MSYSIIFILHRKQTTPCFVITFQASKNLYQTGVNNILKKLNLNETKCSETQFSSINMYKSLWRNKLENDALIEVGISKADLSRYCKNAVINKPLRIMQSESQQ